MLSRRALLAAAASHQQAETRLGGSGRLDADDTPFVHHRDAVREGTDLIQLRRDEQHRRARVALLDDAPVDELDGADVYAARGLCRQQHARLARHLARDDDLLLVATRERSRCGLGAGCTDIEGLYQPLRPVQYRLQP